MRKPEELFDGIFITLETREKIKEAAEMAKKAGITRQQYKDIKKKDHQQMNAFLIRFWQDGYNDGLAAAE